MATKVIALTTEVKKMSSNELKKRVEDHKRDNQYLQGLTNNYNNRLHIIQDGILAKMVF